MENRETILDWNRLRGYEHKMQCKILGWILKQKKNSGKNGEISKKSAI